MLIALIISLLLHLASFIWLLVIFVPQYRELSKTIEAYATRDREDFELRFGKDGEL